MAGYGKFQPARTDINCVKFQLKDNETYYVDIGKALKNECDSYKGACRDSGGRWVPDEYKYEIPKQNFEKCWNLLLEALKINQRDQSALKPVPSFVQTYCSIMPAELKFKMKDLKNIQVAFKIRYDEKEESLRSFKDIPLDFTNRVYPFQKEGIEFAMEKRGRVLIGDEMGVGKTIQALGICALYKNEWPFMVICPSSLKYNWGKEAQEWLRSELPNSGDVQILWKGSDKIDPEAKGVIISYDLAKTISPTLYDTCFKVIVCDEAHNMKNMTSKRTSQLLPIIKRAKRVILLTGTPALAKPIELFPLLAAIRPDAFDDQHKFGERYCNPTWNQFSKKKEYSGCDNITELNFVLKNVMIRRLKRDVLKDLPPKVRQLIDINVDKAKITEIKGIMGRITKSSGQDINSVLEKIMNHGDGGSILPPAKLGKSSSMGSGDPDEEEGSIFNMMNKIYTLTGEAKLKGIIEFLTDMEEYNEKLIIFAFHRSVLDGLVAHAKSRKIDFINIDGLTPATERGALVDKFQKQTKVKYAILGITAASVGLTLTASRTVVFAELFWTPAIIMQAEDRAHRIGQQAESVMVYYLMGKDTIDQSMYDIIKKKFTLTTKMLDGAQAQTFEVEENSKSMRAGSISDFFKSKLNRDFGSKMAHSVKTSLDPLSEDQMKELEELDMELGLDHTMQAQDDSKKGSRGIERKGMDEESGSRGKVVESESGIKSQKISEEDYVVLVKEIEEMTGGHEFKKKVRSKKERKLKPQSSAMVEGEERGTNQQDEEAEEEPEITKPLLKARFLVSKSQYQNSNSQKKELSSPKSSNHHSQTSSNKPKDP